MMTVRLNKILNGINSDMKFGRIREMKLNRIILATSAAVAAFTFGISAYAAANFGLSLLPRSDTKAEAVETVSIPEPAPTDHELAAEPVPISNEIEQVPFNEHEYDFIRTGDYYLSVEDGEVPKSFADIEILSIETHEYNQNAAEGGPFWIPLVPKGHIQAKETFKFERVAIGGKHITFQTATIDGISYKFTGSFPDPHPHSDSHHGQPDIKGRLIKIKDKKWAAEIEAEFYVGGC